MEETISVTMPDGLETCVKALDGMKGDFIKLLYVGHISSITDYFLIVTGTSSPHLRALGRIARETLDEQNIDNLSTNASDEGAWVVVDAFDFIVHIFTKDTREFYNLEGLWKDAETVDISNLVTPNL